MYKFSNIWVRISYKFFPKLSLFLSRLACSRARKLLQGNKLVILVDANVRGKATIHQTAWIDTGKKKWGEVDVDTGYLARINVYANDAKSDDAVNVKYLPPIINLWDDGYLELVTSSEFEEEIDRQPIGRFVGYSIFDYNLFEGRRFESIDGYAFSVSVAFGPKRDFKKEQIDRVNENGGDLYRELVRVFGEKHSLDAWHLSVAERCGAYCLLTMDYKLYRIFNRHKDRPPINAMATKVLTPQAFAKEFSIKPVNLSMFIYNNASYPVRPDLHWPNSRMMSARKRKSE